MKEEDRERYLDAWGDKCMLCGSTVEKEDKCLVSSIIPLNKAPEHADPEYVYYYMSCKDCVKKGELI